MAEKVKQVIVVNTGVPMSRGQLAAQTAHAAVQFMLENGDWVDDIFYLRPQTPEEKYWLQVSFRKAVLKVSSEQALLDLKEKLAGNGIRYSLVEDYGHKTALAIEPLYPDKVDQFTGHLPLF